MIIQKIEKATASNGSQYNKLTFDDKKTYNFFGELNGLIVGDSVDCEFEKKGQYTNLVGLKKAKTSNPAPPISGRHDVVIQRVEKPHSYEFGKAGNRHKVYYNTVQELLDHIELLKEADLLEEPLEIPQIPTQDVNLD